MDIILPLHGKSKYQQNTKDMMSHPNGFSELAFLISTDQDFSIFRKFDELSALNLLEMQSRLTEIEDEPRIIDQHDLAGRGADNTRKFVLMGELDTLLKKYQKALIRQHHIHKLASPTKPVANRIDLWVRRAAEGRSVGGITPADYEPVAPSTEPTLHYWRTRDYVILKSPTYKDTWVEHWTRRYLRRLLQEERPVPADWSGNYFERAKDERFKDDLAFPVALVFLVVPAFLFHYICDGGTRLAILLAFIVGLALAMQIFMGTGRKETLASALAYTGVKGLLLSNGTASKCRTLKVKLVKWIGCDETMETSREEGCQCLCYW